jgi:hypothetical protein
VTNDISLYMTVAVSGLAGLAMVTAAGLTGWRGWLQLKHEELAERRVGEAPAPATSAASRIEIADLKERIRKLEAIAAGVDL